VRTLSKRAGNWESAIGTDTPLPRLGTCMYRAFRDPYGSSGTPDLPQASQVGADPPPILLGFEGDLTTTHRGPARFGDRPGMHAAK